MPRTSVVDPKCRKPRMRAVASWFKKLRGQLTLDRAEPSSALLAASESDLSDRLIAHLSEFQALQHVASTLNVELDRISKAYELATEARSLAFEISLIPKFSANPQLRSASEALRRHWNCAWTNSGVTEAQYRLAIKTVLLYLKRTSDLRASNRSSARALPQTIQ